MKHILPSLTLLAFAPLASAAVIGVEDFSYPDGPIADLTGGTGFDYDNLNGVHTTTVSDWDNVGGAPNVAGGALVTDGSSAKREYNGDIEGSGGTDDPNTERAGALRGAGQVFYRFTIARSAGASWSGASSYDFGGERVFFGVPGGTSPISGVLEYGVEVSGVATFHSGIAADTITRNLVAVLDFDNDLVGLWVDPDGADFYDVSDGSNSTDASGPYTGTNWSTALRFGSGGQVTWDDLTIATTGAEVGIAVPEPSVGILGLLGGLLICRRRRQTP